MPEIGLYEFLLAFGVVLWVAIGIYYLRQPFASMFHPQTYYLAVHGIVFTIRPILAYFLNYNFLYKLYDFTPTMEEKCTVLAGADLALVAFSIACMWLGRATPTLAMEPIPPANIGRLMRSFWVSAVLCLPLGMYSIYHGLTTDIDDMMSLDMSTGVRYNTSGSGYLTDAGLMVGPLCVMIAWLGRFRPLSLLPFGIYFVVSGSSGGRGAFIAQSLALALAYLFSRRQRWLRSWMLSGLVVIFAIFTVVGANRAAFKDYLSGHTSTVVTGNAFEQRPLESMDFGNMEFFEYIVHTIPNRTGTYGYFLDNLQVFTEPVPRALWHGKPFGPPIQMYNLFDYGFPIGMTMSVPGEGWAQGGWVGIAIWAGLFGLFFGWLYQRFATGQRSIFKVAAYIVFLPGVIVIVRDGGLVTILKGTLFITLPILIWWAVYKLSSSRQKRTPAY